MEQIDLFQDHARSDFNSHVIEIQNMEGEIVIKKRVDRDQKDIFSMLNDKFLPTGAYFILISSPAGITRKMVFIRQKRVLTTKKVIDPLPG
ncbi:MAG: hypothetical protein ACOCXD_00630 [Bacteroidota bacterium]